MIEFAFLADRLKMQPGGSEFFSPVQCNIRSKSNSREARID